MMHDFPELFRKRWSKRRLAEEIVGLDVEALRAEYDRLFHAAPRRSERQRYLLGHTGIPSTISLTNRREEHVAIALVGLDVSWPLGDGSRVRFIDYQVPLKERRADAGIGKIDLLGLTDRGRLVVTELKVIGQSGGVSDPPPTALLEGLRYAAVVQANQAAIAREVEEVHGIAPSSELPLVYILGERPWWDAWLQGGVAQVFGEVVGRISAAVGLPIELGSLSDVDLTYGSGGTAPRLNMTPQVSPLDPSLRPEP